MNTRINAVAVVGVCLLLSVAAQAQDQPKLESRTRLEYMRDMVQAIEIVPASGSTLPAKFGKEPILRFADASRETADGAIWKLGAGRPQVLIATEFVRYGGVPNLSYEFLCLTPEKFELRTTAGWKWTPAQSAMTLKPLPAAQAPLGSAEARLLQIKLLARRFAASEMHESEAYRLRLMPQPIDRYVVKRDGAEYDGAAFVFANGTNPEILLFVEATADGWQYGLARMTGAAPIVTLDGEQVWKLPTMIEVGKSWKLDYTGEVHPVE